MKSITFLIGLLALLAPTMVAADNAATCRSRALGVAQAIEKLCSRTNIYTGSNHQTPNEALSNAGHTTIAIMPPFGKAGCTPDEYVPSYWCRVQFYQICASHGNGYGHAYYGNNKCQLWTICEYWAALSS